jgi:hypothetical protein
MEVAVLPSCWTQGVLMADSPQLIRQASGCYTLTGLHKIVFTKLLASTGGWRPSFADIAVSTCTTDCKSFKYHALNVCSMARIDWLQVLIVDPVPGTLAPCSIGNTVMQLGHSVMLLGILLYNWSMISQSYETYINFPCFYCLCHKSYIKQELQYGKNYNKMNNSSEQFNKLSLLSTIHQFDCPNEICLNQEASKFKKSFGNTKLERQLFPLTSH